MAIRDITELMNAYRECSRSLWNVYFSKLPDVGEAQDAFKHIRSLLFDSLVDGQLFYEGGEKEGDIPPLVLRVVPRPRSLILIERPSADSNYYWDQEKDMVVGPDEITLGFIDYFDFSQTPIKDFHYYRCRILHFPSHVEYEGREALIEAVDAKVFHDEDADVVSDTD